MFHSQELSRSAHGRQNFISHQKDPFRVTPLAQLGEEIIGREDRPRPPLNRLQDDPCHLPRCPFDKEFIVEAQIGISINSAICLLEQGTIGVWTG